jgi:hypothetical protein
VVSFSKPNLLEKKWRTVDLSSSVMSVNEVFDEFAVVRRSMKERILPNQILQVQVRDEDSNVVRKHPTTWTSGGRVPKPSTRGPSNM